MVIYDLIMKIGIQGIEGSFHHQAAISFFNSKIDIAPFETFTQVFEALDVGAIDKAVIAIENSLYGSINDTYDLLMRYQPNIVGEVYLHVSLNLLSVNGANLGTIGDVYSQAPALAEAKAYLRSNLPGATVHEYPDTAMSARYISKQKNPKKACLASHLAGELYGLDVISENVEDHKHNYTRFIVISRAKAKIIDADKTSIVIQTNHQAGALYNALGAFSNNQLNLSKIESRPIVNNHGWHYIFYIDFEAGETDERTKLALSQLESTNHSLTILGSYKRSKLPKNL